MSLWLWITVLFANFAEAVAEWRGKAQAEALRKTRQEVHAKRLHEPRVDAPFEMMPSSQLHKDDIVLVKERELIPADGEVIVGVASVDESSITGESAPSSARAAATAAPSRAARKSCPIGSSCGSRPSRARRSWT